MRGIDQGTDAIIQATKGEFKAPENYNRRGKSSGLVKIIFIIIMIVVFLAVSSGGGVVAAVHL